MNNVKSKYVIYEQHSLQKKILADIVDKKIAVKTIRQFYSKESLLKRDKETHKL
jgi:hypothetical protein